MPKTIEDENRQADIQYVMDAFENGKSKKPSRDQSITALIDKFENGPSKSRKEIAKYRIDEAQSIIQWKTTGGADLPPEQQLTRYNRIRHQLGLDKSDVPPQQVGVGEFVGDASWGGLVKRLPVVGTGSEMADMWSVYNASNRAAEGKGTDEDWETIADFLENQAYSARGKSIWAGGLDIASHTPAFAGEIAAAAALTGAIPGIGGASVAGGVAAKQTAKKAGKEAIERFMLKNISKTIGRTLAETAVVLPIVRSPAMVAETLQSTMPVVRFGKNEQGEMVSEKVSDGEDVLPALAKAWYGEAVEGLSEKAGGPIDKILGSVLKKAGVSSKMLEAYLGKPGNTVSKLTEAFKKGGIHSVASEIIEERIADVLRIPIDGVPEISGKQLAQEAVAFSIPGAAKRAVGAGINLARWSKSQLLTPEGAAEFVQAHPEAAAKLAESETPSRSVVEGLVESGSIEKETWSADERKQASNLTQEAIGNLAESDVELDESQKKAREMLEESRRPPTDEEYLHQNFPRQTPEEALAAAEEQYSQASKAFNDYVYSNDLAKPTGSTHSEAYQRWQNLTETDTQYKELLRNLTSARLRVGKVEKIAERDTKRTLIENGDINEDNFELAPIEKFPQVLQAAIRNKARYLLDFTSNEKGIEALKMIAEGGDGDSAVFEAQKSRIVRHLTGEKAANEHDRDMVREHGAEAPLLDVFLKNDTATILEAIDSIERGEPNELANNLFHRITRAPFSDMNDVRAELESILPGYEQDEGYDEEAFSIRPGYDVPRPKRSSSRVPTAHKEPPEDNPGRKPTDSPTTKTWIEPPEMLKLAKMLVGAWPKLKRMREGTQGLFYPLDGSIAIDRAVAGDPVKLARVLAHEIGHLIDWLPNRILARGNLLGRLRTLINFRKGFHPAIEAKNSEIRRELKDLSQWWNPFDRGYNPNYTKYRDSAKELYADAISVLLNDPDALKERAPKFYKAFFDGLDKKPKAQKALQDVLELLAGTPEQLQKIRRGDFRKGFAKVEEVSRVRIREREARKRSLLTDVALGLADRAFPILDDTKGHDSEEAQTARYALDELGYTDATIRVFLENMQNLVSNPLIQEGITLDQMGEYLAYRRMMTERKDIANSFGHNAKTAGQAMDDLRKELGEERFKLMESKMAIFDDAVFEVVEEAVDTGVYNRELFETKLKPNKGNWAAFAVVDYITEHMPAGIRKQVGTFKEIGNPFTMSLLKMISLHRAIALNKAKNSVRDFYMKEIPRTLVKTKSAHPKAGNGFLTVMEDGKPVNYECDKYIADVFKHSDIQGLGRVAKAIGTATYKIFHPLYVTVSPGWQIFNLPRDFKRTYKNLSSGKSGSESHAVAAIRDIIRVPKAYVKAIGPAWRRAGGKFDPLIREMQENKALDNALASYDWSDESTTHERMLKRHGLMNQEQEKQGRRILGAIGSIMKGTVERIGTTTETISKVAAWKVLEDNGIAARERAYIVRNYIGTPNYRTKGRQTYVTNSLAMYSNVILQGLRADWTVATKPKTAGGYWLRSMLVDFLPKAAMVGAAAGLFGATLAELMDLVPDYDKLKYVVIPLGFVQDEKTGEMKVRYVRLPHDDVNRIICGLLWEMGKGKDAKVSNMISQVFGEIPNVSPLLSIASNWILFASGQNPKDYFRGREIIGRDAFNAGGWYAARDMTRWTLNQFGVLSTLAHGAIGEPGRLAEETTYEKIIGSIPGFDRVYKETNRGFYDDAMAEKVEQEAEKSVRKLKLDNLTRYYAKTRYRLNLLGEDKLSEYDRRRRATINYFFRQSYLPITQAIADAEDNGRKDEANGLRAQLAQDAQELKQLMANRTEFESKADSLMAADRIDDLVAARPLKADKVDEWKQKKAEAKKWLEDRGYSNSEIRSMLLSNSKDKPTTRKEKMNRLNRALAVTE